MPTLWMHVSNGPVLGPHVARFNFDNATVSRLRALSEACRALKAEEIVFDEAPDAWLGVDSDCRLVGPRLVVVPDGFWFEVREKSVDGRAETEIADLGTLEDALARGHDMFVPDTDDMRALISEIAGSTFQEAA